MSAVATAPAAARSRRTSERRGAHRLFEPGELTLDRLVSATWARLVESGAGECLVCGATTTAARPCPDCGSELS